MTEGKSTDVAAGISVKVHEVFKVRTSFILFVAHNELFFIINKILWIKLQPAYHPYTHLHRTAYNNKHGLKLCKPQL